MRALTLLALTALLWMRPVLAPALATSDVILGFGATYSAADGQATHRGVDVRMGAGAEVAAPCAGEVVFVGNVPSGNRTVLALSLATASGRVTLMPLDRASVKVGARVEAGQTVATLAGSGDPSSAESHLHLGLKTGDLYRDPTALLAAAAGATGAPEPGAQAAPAGAASPARPTNAGAGSTAAVTGNAPAGSATGASSGAPAVVIGDIATAPDAAQTSATTADAAPSGAENRLAAGEIAPGISLAPAGSAAPGSGSTEVAAPPTALQRFARVAGGAVSEPLGLASVLASMIASGVVLTRRLLERRLVGNMPVSDRLGSTVAARAGR